MGLGSKGLGSDVGRGSSSDFERISGGDSRWPPTLKMSWAKATTRQLLPCIGFHNWRGWSPRSRLQRRSATSGWQRTDEGTRVGAGWLFVGRERQWVVFSSPKGKERRSTDGWERLKDPTTVGKIDVDLVLVLVQHDGSRSGKEEEPSLHVGENGQR
ncbi:hypothetical protein BHM03_00054643 [Ensete ventricosum]|nr:hypothetical protein BHM03_00054643 [Ensete ventricosum]